MKKFLLITLVAFFAFGSFAKNDLKNITTVYTNVPVKLMFKKDSIMNVIIDEQYQFVKYEIVNDTVLKVNYNSNLIETLNDIPVVKIKTTRTLNVECSRYLKKFF